MNEITLRKATIDDMELTFNWRNAPENRYYCIASSDLIDITTHTNWFNKILVDKNRYLLIAEINKNPIGVLRYDIINNSAEISIHLKPGTSGKGIGTALIVKGSAWLKDTVPSVKHIIANILPENIPSQKAFAKAGFRTHHLCLTKDI